MALTRDEQVRIGLAGSRFIVQEQSSQDQDQNTRKRYDQSCFNVENEIQDDPKDERQQEI